MLLWTQDSEVGKLGSIKWQLVVLGPALTIGVMEHPHNYTSWSARFHFYKFLPFKAEL